MSNPKMIRAKFMVVAITEHSWGGGGQKTVKLEARYDPAIPEDQRFYEATPTGSLEMLVNNPAALEMLQLGHSFYIDLTPVPPETQNAG